MKLIPKVSLPESKKGSWSIEYFTISEADADIYNMRSAFSFSSKERSVSPGDFTRLLRNNKTIMTDTKSEIADHREPVRRASGNVLIAGLGLGVVLQACLLKEEVEKATVIELSTDVIDLVAPHYTERFGSRFEVINADIFNWKPPKGERYNMAWYDIWDNICGDNYEGMKELHRKFGRRVDWQGSWCKDECRRLSK